MSSVRGRIVVSIAICLLVDGASGCTKYHAPPTIPAQAADTTALGIRAELPAISMWPGEIRRVMLPLVKTKTPRTFTLRGHEWLSFRLHDDTSRLLPRAQGMFATVSNAACVLRVDSLAVPGDTINFSYTVSTTTNPPVFSRWSMRIVIEMPPLVVNGSESRPTNGPVPNPFNPVTTLRYRVEKDGPVVVQIFDVRGTYVATVVDTKLNAGKHRAEWDGRDARGNAVGSGVYFARLSSPAGTKTFKLTVVK